MLSSEEKSQHKCTWSTQVCGNVQTQMHNVSVLLPFHPTPTTTYPDSKCCWLYWRCLSSRTRCIVRLSILWKYYVCCTKRFWFVECTAEGETISTVGNSEEVVGVNENRGIVQKSIPEPTFLKFWRPAMYLCAQSLRVRLPADQKILPVLLLFFCRWTYESGWNLEY